MSEHRIHADHPCLPGHFPGQPVVPGVVLLDEILAAARTRFGALTLRGAPQVKFLEPLLPEQTFVIELDGTPPQVAFRCLRDGALLASGKLQLETA